MLHLEYFIVVLFWEIWFHSTFFREEAISYIGKFTLAKNEVVYFASGHPEDGELILQHFAFLPSGGSYLPYEMMSYTDSERLPAVQAEIILFPIMRNVKVLVRDY